MASSTQKTPVAVMLDGQLPTTRMQRQDMTAGLASQLAEVDRHHLARFDELRKMLRDRVRSVALKYQVAAYIVGRPGTGKTYTVMETLRQLEADKQFQVSYTMKNAKVTAPGLWRLFSDYRESTVVLDDVPSIVTEKTAQAILIAGLGGEPGTPRKITYSTGEADGRKDIDFTGGIIAISNVALRRDPIADAVASRTALLEYEPDDDMMAAFMRLRALRGYRSVSAEEAMGVVEFLIAESRSGEYRLDLRAMTKSLSDYELWRHGLAETHWHDLVRSFLKKLKAPETARPVKRGEKRDRLLELAAEITAKYPDRNQRPQREAEWSERTKLSADQFYRYAAQAREFRAA